MSAPISITGNVTADPTLRFQHDGTPVANLTVAVTPRAKQPDGSWGDGPTAFYRVAAWKSLGENVAESIHRGDRVVVVGTLRPREYEHDGQTRLSLDVTADSIGPDLRFATAQVSKANRQQVAPQPRPQGDPWSQSTGAGGWGGADQSAPF